MILRNSKKETPKATGYLREGGGSCLKDRHVHSHQNTHMNKLLSLSLLSPSLQSLSRYPTTADEKNRHKR